MSTMTKIVPSSPTRVPDLIPLVGGKPDVRFEPNSRMLYREDGAFSRLLLSVDFRTFCDGRGAAVDAADIVSSMCSMRAYVLDEATVHDL